MSVAAIAPVVGPAQPTTAPRFWRRLLRRPVAVVCLSYLALVLLVAIVAPIALPAVAHEHAGDLTAIRLGPTADHLLGTDALGRDVLQRLLVGARVTMLGVAYALVVVLLLGVPLGLAAGFYGGSLDRIVGWLADLAFSLPAIVIVLLVLAVFPQSMLAAMVTLGVITAPGLMRIVRSATLPVREELYVAAARVAGLSRPSIIVRHVLPRIAGVIIVQASLLAAVALLVQTGLAFLNLVVAAPAPSWGGMVAEGATTIELQPWLIWPPGLVIAMTVLALGLLGDAVRDATAEGWSAPVVSGRRGRRTRTAPATSVPVGDDRDAPLGEDRSEATHEEGALLSVESLSVAFASPTGAVPVVRDLSFDIRAGETVGLLGESGCGKSVTAAAIVGLLPGLARIEAGKIVFCGQDLAGLRERELRRVRGKEIGIVSQEPMISLNPVFRVGTQLSEAVREHHGVSRRAARLRALELLDQVRLPDPAAVARRYPHELSGGMAQRVAIARALAGEPRLLIADEPTTALDVTVQAEILQLLRDLQHDRQMAILFVTHDWGVVADICDRAVVMYAGEIVERAPLLSMFREPLHPYTDALLASNPHNAPTATTLPTIPGTVPQPGAWPQGCHFHPRCRYATTACVERPIPVAQPEPGRETRCLHYEQLSAAR